MKKWQKLLIIILIITVFVISPFFQYAKSVAVMAVYSASEYNQSVMKNNDIEIKIPGGLSTMDKDWYPFVMTFNPTPSSFSRRVGRDVEISIMYNFGAFEYLKGASSYYDDQSPYYNSFYGAYVIHDENQSFGFNADGTLNEAELSIVPDYDMRILVLRSLGCTTPTFDYTVDDISYGNSYLGIDDWTIMTSTIETQSPIHAVKKDYQAYIQYGKPYQKDYNGEDFPLMTVYGRVYAKYFAAEKLTVCFYIIGSDLEAMDFCDSEILQKSELIRGNPM
ncbi:MAG: hypothetical protein PF505_09125 [Vallitaleaceae bacterium]|jgi:hypothetical protein|nr:hypothetical protein [Vallitaleaceae bacterium]